MEMKFDLLTQTNSRKIIRQCATRFEQSNGKIRNEIYVSDFLYDYLNRNKVMIFFFKVFYKLNDHRN